MVETFPARRIGPAVWALVALLALALGLLPPKELALALGGLLVVGLALAAPVCGVYLAVLSVPVQELVQLPGGLSVTQAAVLLAAGAWALRTLAHPERRLVLGPGAALWAAMIWALLLSSSTTPYSVNEALKETSRWVVAFLVWLIAVNTITQRRHVVGLLACMLLAPAVAAGLGVWQFFSGNGPESFRIDQALPYVRAYSSFGTPNAFAGYLNMAWPLALALAVGWFWQAGRRLDRWMLALALWGCAGLLMAALGLTFSRGAWLGGLIGLTLMPLALGGRLSRLSLVVIALGVLVLALGGVNLLPQPLQNRLASITRAFAFFDPATVTVTPENFAVVERMAQMKAGWDMFVTHPLTGVGPGNFNLAYADYSTPPWYGARGHAHNYYLNIAALTGLVGLAAYLALAGGMAYLAFTRTRRTQSLFWRSVGVGCCGIIAAVAGHNLFENLHALNMGIQLAAAWALVCLPEEIRNRNA
ncbi:MAG: O-antigen ligase family protein [Roseiflexaceae bacterium]